MARIIVVGGNFAGLTSALELKRKLGNIHEVLMISKSANFLFVPSLIWIPFGKRKLKDVLVPLKPVLKKAKVHFICTEVTKILAEDKQYFKELSTKDSLTDTYNRLKFNESLRIQIEVARRYGNTFSLIMFDIDHFKQFNDQNGHIFGDMVLVKIANLVKESVREVDVFARWGGEEFVILLPETNCQEASALAERLRKSICKESMKNGMALTCSFGVTSFSSQDDEDLIMDRVDTALYKAKL